MTEQVAVKGQQPAEEKKEKTKKEMTRFQWTWHEMKRQKVGYYMIIPFLIMFICFTVIPVLLSILLSFTSFNMLQMPKFIFLDNYLRMFLDDDLFITAFKNTLIFAVATGPTSYILSFLVAWFINELSPRMRAFVTVIFYSPSIAGSAYVVWQVIFREDIYGYVNGWLMKMGFISSPIAFFSNAAYVVPIVIIVSLWSSLGTAFLAFIAGLQGVDRHLYEAGAVDGVKNRWQELWNITLPYMKPQLMFGAVLSITQSFGFGAIVDALCGFPSVEYAAHTIVHHLNDYGGQRYEMGYASAIAVILFVVMVGANLIIKKGLSKIGQ